MENNVLLHAVPGCTNFAFLGEAGCGKSEISVNLAIQLAKENEKPVHFFDLDMTKPLFRSRDVCQRMRDAGVVVHYEEQFYDAPTLTGGIVPMLRNTDVYTILDIGGDYIGARSVGGYAPWLNAPDTALFYIVNPYRPWSMDTDNIDAVLSQILGVSHLRLDRLNFIANPNLGIDTRPEEVDEGIRQVIRSVGEYVPVAFACAMQQHIPMLTTDMPVMPLDPYLSYPWEIEITVKPLSRGKPIQ